MSAGVHTPNDEKGVNELSWHFQSKRTLRAVTADGPILRQP